MVYKAKVPHLVREAEKIRGDFANKKKKIVLIGDLNKIIVDFSSDTIRVKKKWDVYSKCPPQKKIVSKEFYIQ